MKSARTYSDDGKLKSGSLLASIICCLDMVGAKERGSVGKLEGQRWEMSRLYSEGSLCGSTSRFSKVDVGVSEILFFDLFFLFLFFLGFCMPSLLELSL